MAFATLAAACALAASVGTAGRPGCAVTGYSYAGVRTFTPARGLTARITPLSAARVTSGHVAAWVGVGEEGAAQGAGSWLQIGISSVPGGRTELYYEVQQPGSAAVYEPLGAARVGRTHRVAVLETETPDVWTVWLDGRQASPPLELPGSHATWTLTAATETYDGGATRCNAYSFKFGDLQAAGPSGAWRRLAAVRSFVDRSLSMWSPVPGTVYVVRP